MASSARPEPAAQIAGLIFALLLVDDKIKVVEANDAAEVMLGQSAKRLLGRDLLDLIEISDQRVIDGLRNKEARVTARGVRVVAAEKGRLLNITASPLPSHAGWQVVTLSDAGQGELAAESEGSISLRGPAILAHEIKNPLAAIRGAAQFLARKLESGERKLADTIMTEVDRIAGLIDRMQRLGSKHPEPVEACNLHECVRNAIATVRAGGLGDVTLGEEFDPSIPPVLANAEGLEQVLINLLSNARDAAAKNGEGRIVVKTRFVSGLAFSAFHLGRTIKLPIEITVSDNGEGVDPELRDHLFDPFVSSKPHGQGLGLALVRKLVRDMDGRIAHQRDEGAGLTHFRVHLSVAK